MLILMKAALLFSLERRSAPPLPAVAEHRSKTVLCTEMSTLLVLTNIPPPSRAAQPIKLELLTISRSLPLLSSQQPPLLPAAQEETSTPVTAMSLLYW